MGSSCASDYCGASSVCDGKHCERFPRAQHEDVAHPTTDRLKVTTVKNHVAPGVESRRYRDIVFVPNHDRHFVGCAWVHHAHRIVMVRRRIVTANISCGFRVRNMKTLRTLRLVRRLIRFQRVEKSASPSGRVQMQCRWAGSST